MVAASGWLTDASFFKEGEQYIKDCCSSFCYHQKRYRNHYSENRSSGLVRESDDAVTAHVVFSSIGLRIFANEEKE